MKEFKAQNTGNKVIINCAKTSEVLRLKKVIYDEFIKHPLGLKLKDGDISALERDVDFTGVLEFVKNTLLSIDSSEDFQEAIFDCLKYCTYKNTYKINIDLFDNQSVPEAREDYYEIIIACIEENLRPFAKSLISTWKTLVQEKKITQLLNIV